jgi:hypothetical protein
MNGSHVPVPTSARVFRLEDYRRPLDSDAPTAPSSDAKRSEVLATLARCDHFIYAGVTPEDVMHFGTDGFCSFTHTQYVRGVIGSVSDFDYENAVHLRDAALRLLGRLQEIIDAGDGQ